MSAYSPDRVADRIRLKTDALDDPPYRAGYLRFGAAYDWRPNDPRLIELADAMVSYMRSTAMFEDPAAPTEAEFDDTIVALLDSQSIQAPPHCAG